MRTSTSFAILALLASAGTSLAAPVKGDKYGKSAVNVKSAPDHGLVNVHARVVTEVSLLDKGGKHKGHGHGHEHGHEHGHDHGHRDVTPGVIDNGHLVNGNQGNNDVGPLPPVNRPINAHSADTIHPVTGGKDDMANVKPVTSDKMLKDDKIAILPNDPVVKGKDGMVDIQQGNLAGHVIQTPGKDKTIAEIQAGDGTPAHKSDVKVNVPIDGPAGGLTGLEYGKNGNIPSQLLGKQAGNKDTQVLKAKPLADVKIEGSSSSPPHPKPTPSHASQNHGNPKASSAQNHPSQSSKAAPSKSAAHAENAKPPSAPTASSSSTNGAKPATSSKATNHSPSHDSGHSSSAHQSSASPPRPSQSAAGDQGKDTGRGGKKEDDDNFNLNSGAFRPTRPGKGGNENGDSGTDSHNDSNHETEPQDNNAGKNEPTRLDNGGDGHTIGLSSSTRRGYKTVDLQIAKVQIGELPERVQPCDPTHYSHGEAVDICIEADLLAYAPKHTFKCPDELQHDIHIHEDTAKDGTINSKIGKQVAKYVRLCVDAGVL